MMEERNLPIQVIEDALQQGDPTILAQLTDYLASRESTLELRNHISAFTVAPRDYDLVFQWMWHHRFIIATLVRTIVHLLEDFDLKIEIFTRLAETDMPDVPFNITYDSAEREFKIDMPRLPGWAVSHYGRDDPKTDGLLLALERIYAKLHPGNVPGCFRG